MLGLVVAPFLFFIMPRIMFSLHPQSVINAQGKVEMESRMVQVLLAGSARLHRAVFLDPQPAVPAAGSRRAEIRHSME